jgi:predicted nucleic acid-binding protein
MRTTLTLDPDVATKAKKGAPKLHKPFKEVINAALRVGLDEVLKPPPARPYRTKARPLGLRQGLAMITSANCLPELREKTIRDMLRAGNATGNLVSDAHLAALAVEHNSILASTDADFARFRGLRWRNPIA